MSARDSWTLLMAVVVYSGPLLPLLATLLLTKASPERFRRNVRLTLILTGAQALTFAPYVLSLLTEVPDAEHALLLPFGAGILLFVGALLYAIFQYRHVHAVDRLPGDA